MYNRLTWPMQMAEFLSDTGCEVILIDNNSTYQPLLEWYKTCPYKVHQLTTNHGHKVVWTADILKEYSDQHYIVTDHDLDISNIPHDYVEMLHKGLSVNPSVIKSGLSLEINDLPKNNYAKQVYDWELKFWQAPVDINGFNQTVIDTTFALYDRSREYPEFPDNNEFFVAVRSPRPYTAIHRPWYLTKESLDNNAEEKYYQLNTSTYWANIFKKEFDIK